MSQFSSGYPMQQPAPAGPSSLARGREADSLADVLDRVLDKGVVLHGDITLSVADVDLVYVGLRVLIASVEAARRAGAEEAG